MSKPDSILVEMAKSDPERLREILIVSQVEVREVVEEEESKSTEG